MRALSDFIASLGVTAYVLIVAVLFFCTGYWVGSEQNPKYRYIPRPAKAERPVIKQRAVVTEKVSDERRTKITPK